MEVLEVGSHFFRRHAQILLGSCVHFTQCKQEPFNEKNIAQCSFFPFGLHAQYPSSKPMVLNIPNAETL